MSFNRLQASGGDGIRTRIRHLESGGVGARAGRLDLEIPSAWGPAVADFVHRAAAAPWPGRASEECEDLPRVHALRLGINVSLGARQAVRAVGVALGLEAPRVNALARQVPLLSGPGAIEQVMTHAPAMGLSDAPHVEPARTIRASRRNWMACPADRVRIRRRTPSPSSRGVCWTGCQRSG
jgi:hypothetical protein